MRISEIKRFWTDNNLFLGDDEGFCLGYIDDDISGIMVSWTADIGAIEAAKRNACNLMIIHNEFFFPPLYSNALLEHNLSDKVTYPRISRLLKYNISVFIANNSLHMFCIDDEIALLLDLGKAEVEKGLHDRYYTIEPVEAEILAEKIMMKMNNNIRLTGNMKKIVSRVVLMTGGAGIAHNSWAVESVLHLQPDVIICGETDEYPMYAANDLGIPIIEIGHTESENPGLRYFAKILMKEYPAIPIFFHEIKKPWQLL